MNERWGKYELTALIARGGMAEVFRAEQLGPSGFVRPVCLKCVRGEYSSDPEFVSMFESEARIAATLQHPNIVHVSDFDRHDGRLFLVMELVDGCDLRQLLARTRQLGLLLPARVAVHVLEGLLLALDHAHNRMVEGSLRPVVHRDVSPHNILVSAEGMVKLADFGIAKARGLSDVTRTGVVKGKLAYLSPEQASGELATPLSDLFSAGLVMHEMLSGQRTRTGEDDRAVAAQLHNFAPAAIPGVSQALSGFISRLIAPAPADRFPSAKAALQALREVGVPAASTHEVGRLVARLRALPDVGAQDAVAPSTFELSEVTFLDYETLPETRMSRPSPFAQKPSPRAVIAAVVIGLATLVIAGGYWSTGRALTPDQRSESEPAPAMSPGPTPVPKTEPVAQIRTLPAALPQEGDVAVVAAEADGISVPQEAPVSVGALSVFVRPWAKILVDGVPRGQTPLKNLRLVAGPHKIMLVNDEIGYRRSFEVELDEGEHEVINRTIPR